ncbi:MAG: FAD-dependent oxidoreductase [Firmicutes bacterium]|nr:FAD-dependent oxidoreductase [Bacillota bacterium]
MTSSSSAIVIGAGLAGLQTAWHLAERHIPVTIVHKTDWTLSSSYLAQGGVAGSATLSDRASHMHDTLTAARGLADPAVVHQIVRSAPDLLQNLLQYGLFQTHASGTPDLAREAGHAAARIWHAPDGDTGKSLTTFLYHRAAAHPLITFLPGRVHKLLAQNGRIVGVEIQTAQDSASILTADHTIIATGGYSGIFPVTSNPSGSTGDGIVLAYLAGAVISDLEFIQFHPTVLSEPAERPALLLTEALRGIGAHLIDEQNTRIVGHLPAQELAPRDEVAFALHQHRQAGHGTYLSLRHLSCSKILADFPALAQRLRQRGWNLCTDALPIRPGAHFTMGGIVTDMQGRTTLPGLWALGEAAMIGLHGANRLASNSLLEALVMGERVARSISQRDLEANLPPSVHATSALSSSVLTADPPWLSSALETAMGPFRHADALQDLSRRIRPLLSSTPSSGLWLAYLGAQAAQARRESRGAHRRQDFPTGNPAYAGHFFHHVQKGLWFHPT